MTDSDSYLVNVSRLPELLRQERRALLPRRRGVVERAFRTPDTISSTRADGDTDIGTSTTPVEHLVSLGLTWGKLRDALHEEGRRNGVLWMGQDTFLQSYQWPLNANQVPQGFRHLLDVHTMKSSLGTMGEPEDDPEYFGVRVIGTNPTSDSYVCLMNLLAEIIASDESITFVALDTHLQTMLHFPTAALERLVTKSRSKRRLGFHVHDIRNRLSNEQVRILFNGSCNTYIELEANCTVFDDGGAALIEAIHSNQCPVKLRLIDMQDMPETRFVELTSALSINQSLKEIEFGNCFLGRWTDRKKSMLLRAVTENRGLHSLSFYSGIILDDNMWQVFWSLVAQNTCLTRITFHQLNSAATDPLIKAHRSNCVVEALKRNITLTYIISEEREFDPVIMQEAVLPMLELNSFRPRIQAIRQVRNDAVRWGLFGKALLHRQFQQYPTLLFQLLLVNSDGGFGALVKPASEAGNIIPRCVKSRHRSVTSN